MKNNVKKAAALFLAAVTVMACLSACGGKKADTIKIGATGPLTGGASSYGNSVLNGATIAVDEINAAGGMNGIKLEFKLIDDKAEAAAAASAYDSLMEWGMVISLGSVTSGSCEAFAKRAVGENVFFMTPSASAASVIETGKNAFRVCFGDPDQGVLAADKLTEDYQKIGCIYDTSDTYSKGIFDAFEARMKELGTAFETRTFDQDTNKDFSAQVEGLKDCDVIFLPIYYTEAALIARTCTSKELSDTVLFGCDGLDGVAALIDSSVKNKISYITPFSVYSNSIVTNNFVKAYRAKYNADPDQFAADGYDAVYAVVKAMEAANVKSADVKASDLCDRVIKAITDPSFKYDGATGLMTWDASGACTKIPIIVEVGNAQ